MNENKDHINLTELFYALERRIDKETGLVKANVILELVVDGPPIKTGDGTKFRITDVGGINDDDIRIELMFE